ncbi:hypothetical protein ABW19_dt0203215 [Dactylella cylindrospora]|nr:hypothetical protein ABW19_dt0203215 [Dactylella cylindrospora]
MSSESLDNAIDLANNLEKLRISPNLSPLSTAMDDSENRAIKPPDGVCLVNLLPPEILYRIFSSFDDAGSLCRAERTCHFWRSIIDSQSLWRNLAIKLAGNRILPERVNELGKGSLITGRYIPDDDSGFGGVGGGGRWIYLYRDLVRNIHTLNRIGSLDHSNYLDWTGEGDGEEGTTTAFGPEVVTVGSSMLELSAIPHEYQGSKDSYVTRKIDFALSAIEGMRLQYRPLLISKTPAFTDAICPGETVVDDSAWVYLADQATLWPRVTAEDIFKSGSARDSSVTIQRGVFRAGKHGICDEGDWCWTEKSMGETTKPEEIKTDEATVDPSEAPGPTEGEQSEQKKRHWKVFATKAKSATSSNLSLPLIQPESRSDIETPASELPPNIEAPRETSNLKPPFKRTRLPIKWATPIDSVNTLPHARRWNASGTVFDSYKNMFNLQPTDEEHYRSSIERTYTLTNVLHSEMKNQAHSDPNLRIVYQRAKPGSIYDIVAYRVDRLALPSSSSLNNNGSNGKEPEAAVNQSWSLFGKASWSLNSVPVTTSTADIDSGKLDPSGKPIMDPYWYHETQYINPHIPSEGIWETGHTWEYRSCGDYLIISDDISMHGPCTISCFKAGYHKEKDTVDASKYLRGAALRNYTAAGPTSDLIWQKSLKQEGYLYDETIGAVVPSTDTDRAGYFLDNDGLSLNSRVVIYATRKKVYYERDLGNLAFVTRTQSCMEFHVIAIETGHTINILELDHERRDIQPNHVPWYGWTSFAMSDTHLVATVGGNVHRSAGAENSEDPQIRTWKKENRYGREEVFIWPLDVPEQNLSLRPEERMIQPNGKLGVGFDLFRWWRRDRYVGISREGRFVCVSSKYDLVVWDLWTSTQPIHYIFDKKSGGLKLGPDGYPPTNFENVSWNGIWLQYRDVIIDPEHQALTNSNPNPAAEKELHRGVIFIPNTEIRMLLNGADYDFQSNPACRNALEDLGKRMAGRFRGLHGDEDSSSDEEDEDFDSDDDDDDEGDHDADLDWDEDGEFFWGGGSGGLSDGEEYDDEDDDMEDWDDPEYMGPGGVDGADAGEGEESSLFPGLASAVDGDGKALGASSPAAKLIRMLLEAEVAALMGGQTSVGEASGSGATAGNGEGSSSQQQTEDKDGKDGEKPKDSIDW